MSILSDSEIRQRMSKGELILDGNLKRAEYCSYSFLPGRIFLAGREDTPISFSGRQAGTEAFVGPGEMVWIRTLERVCLPTDLSGFWWQTNTLSRKGLMLVNMSMAEPGYEGPLACLFVNFGKDRIAIRPTTVIAKMVFSHIHGSVAQSFGPSIKGPIYDDILRDLARDQPQTFLQVAQLASGLQQERELAVSEIKLEGQKVKAQAETDLAELKRKELGQFQADTWKYTVNSILAAGLAIVVFTAALAGLGWLKGEFTPDMKAVARAEAENMLSQRVMVAGTPQAESNARILQRMEELDHRLSRVEGPR